MSGRRVTITVDGISHDYLIREVRPEGYLISPPGQDQYSLVVPVGDQLQVYAFNRPHTVQIVSEFEDKLNSFIEEARRLSGEDIIAETGTRFINLVFTSEHNHKYIYARIEKATGDIYSQSGTTARGNLLTSPYGGKELIDKYGVIVNRSKLQRRLQDLTVI